MNADPHNEWVPLPAPPPAPWAATPQAPPRKDDAVAVTIFVLGILGIVFCALFAPFAWIKGASYRTTCRILDVPPNGLATAGWVLGIVGTVVLVLTILAMVAISSMH